MTALEKEKIVKILRDINLKEISLLDFVRENWQIVEPGSAFVDGWHIHAICEHLEAQTNLQIRNLLINMPPRHAKSLLVSVFWQVWDWIKNPSIKSIYASYGQQLSTRDSLKCKRLISHPYFKSKYGHLFKLTSDQSTKTRFDNDKLGYRIATSVEGIGTGEGGDRIVCLTGDTKLRLEYGELTIRDIVENKVGGKVASFSNRLNKIEYQTIINWFENDSYELIRFHISNGKKLVCTLNHPIFCLNRGGYIFAKDMHIKDAVMCIDGMQHLVDKIEYLPDECKVYNIEVAVNNNYYANGILVHNCDDPHNVLESESDTVREGVITWWDETMGSRGNDPKTVTRTIVMQRVHARDLSAHVLTKGNYEHLCLPEEYEGSNYITSIGFKDPRTIKDELLWTERFNDEDIKQIKKDVGSYAYAGQYQQRPAPREGGIVKAAWFCHFKITRNAVKHIINPLFNFVLQSWDTAFEEGQDNDYSVCTTWGYNQSGAYLLHRFKEKPDFPTLTRRAIMLANEWRPNKIIIERKASGHSLIQTLKKETQLPIIGVNVKGDKMSRLSAVSGFIESGRVFIVEGAEWEADFIDEICMFPNAGHDDQVDSMTHALHELFIKSNQTQQDLRNFNIMGR